LLAFIFDFISRLWISIGSCASFSYCKSSETGSENLIDFLILSVIVLKRQSFIYPAVLFFESPALKVPSERFRSSTAGSFNCTAAIVDFVIIYSFA
tara:strand:- start:198 stop:485 length:288 start_codon:yes stop_codon:yes gene_type:complete